MAWAIGVLICETASSSWQVAQLTASFFRACEWTARANTSRHTTKTLRGRNRGGSLLRDRKTNQSLSPGIFTAPQLRICFDQRQMRLQVSWLAAQSAFQVRQSSGQIACFDQCFSVDKLAHRQ